MKKQTVRIVIDVAMALLLPLLMAYSLIGEELHEVIGTAMMVLFIVHHVLNRKWFGSLNRGRYDASRIFHTVLDLLLLAVMILQPLSGILMSRYLYTFIKVEGVAALVRSVHMVCAYWGFVLMSIHAGTHLVAPLRMLERKSSGMRNVILILMLIVSVYGIYAFVKRGFAGYMFMRTMFAFFDYSESVMAFIGDYLAAMVLFMSLGLVIEKLLGKR